MNKVRYIYNLVKQLKEVSKCDIFFKYSITGYSHTNKPEIAFNLVVMAPGGVGVYRQKLKTTDIVIRELKILIHNYKEAATQ